MSAAKSTALMLCACSLGACVFGMRVKTRRLNELGTVEVPSRLEDRSVEERPQYARYLYDRTVNSIFLMGSNRPVSENLALVIWERGREREGWDRAMRDTPERTGQIQWRQEGEYRVGEGVHEVNASKHPAWVVVRASADKQATAGYMMWKKNGSLAEAKKVVDRVLGSLRLEMGIAEYLRLGVERPEKMARVQREAFRKVLAAKGLELKPGDPVKEAGGVLYHYFVDSRPGERFDAFYLLGDLPAAKRWRVLHPAPPRGIANLPEVCGFSWDGSEWATDCSLIVPKALTEAMAARHSDKQRTYFYVTVSDFPTMERAGGFNVEVFWEALDFLKGKFAKGELTEAVY